MGERLGKNRMYEFYYIEINKWNSSIRLPCFAITSKGAMKRIIKEIYDKTAFRVRIEKTVRLNDQQTIYVQEQKKLLRKLRTALENQARH